MKTITVRNPDQNPYLEVRHGSHVAKIYSAERQKNGSEYSEHTLTYIEAGRRVRKTFSDLAKAKAEAEVVMEKIASGQSKVLQLTSTDRETYLIALDELRAIDVPLHTATREYRHAVETLHGKGSVLEAAQFYIRHGAPDLPKKTVKEIVAELVEAKKRDRLSPVYIADIQMRLGWFAQVFPGHITEITTRQIETWLRAREGGPRSRNNCGRAITTLFRFARKMGYLPPDRSTAADSLSRARVIETEIEIFTPAEIRRMLTRLKKYRPEFVPFVAIGAFAGLRTAEIKRLDWSEVRLDESFIHVSAKKAKTGQRRLVPIQPNLAAWLLPYRKPAGPVCPIQKVQTILPATVRTKITQPDGSVVDPGIEWKHNGLRHSYGSYRLPIAKSAAEVALEMGNTPAMIFRHYRELVTAKQAEEYWGISPNACGNILAFAAQGS
jgi:integrase